MFKEQMNKIKSLMVKNPEINKDEKRDKNKIQNLAFFLVILIITLIAVNAILKDDNKKIDNTDSEYKQLATENSNNESSTSSDELEKRIENILGTMSGVRQSPCISYIFTIFRSSCNV